MDENENENFVIYSSSKPIRLSSAEHKRRSLQNIFSSMSKCVFCVAEKWRRTRKDTNEERIPIRNMMKGRKEDALEDSGADVVEGISLLFTARSHFGIHRMSSPSGERGCQQRQTAALGTAPDLTNYPPTSVTSFDSTKQPAPCSGSHQAATTSCSSPGVH